MNFNRFEEKIVYSDNSKTKIPIAEKRTHPTNPKTPFFSFPSFEKAINSRENYHLSFFRNNIFAVFPEELFDLKEFFISLTDDEKLAFIASFMTYFLVNLASDEENKIGWLLFLFFLMHFKELRQVKFSESESECSLYITQENGADVVAITFQKCFFADLQKLFSKSSESCVAIKCSSRYYLLTAATENKILFIKMKEIERPRYHFAFEKSAYARFITWLIG